MVRIYTRMSSFSDPKKSGRPLLNKSANKRLLSEVRKDGIDHYLPRIDDGKHKKICYLQSQYKQIMQKMQS